MTLNKTFKNIGVMAIGFSFGVAAEKVSAMTKKEESEETIDEVVTEDFENEVVENSEKE